MNYGTKFDTGDPRRNVYLALEGLYCGCGQPWAAMELIHDLLRAAPFHSNQDGLEELCPNRGIEMVVLGALDRNELIEHGGSIGGSWLTPRGEEALEGLNVIRANEGYQDYAEELRCVHGRSLETQCPECLRGDE